MLKYICIKDLTGFEITMKNHCEGDIFEHRCYLCHSDFSSLFGTLIELCYSLSLIWSPKKCWSLFMYSSVAQSFTKKTQCRVRNNHEKSLWRWYQINLCHIFLRYFGPCDEFCYTPWASLWRTILSVNIGEKPHVHI